MQLRFDPDDPPAEPPAGADRLIWSLGRALLHEHQIGADGLCQARACQHDSVVWPCERHRLAERGLVQSLTRRNAMFAWSLSQGWPFSPRWRSDLADRRRNRGLRAG